MGASRFQSSSGLWLFGKVRRTDWLPVDFGLNTNDQTRRSDLSGAEDSDEPDFEDYEPPDEWDEWDEDIEEAYEEVEAGDDDFEDCAWKELLKEARNAENQDMPEEDQDDESLSEDEHDKPIMYDLLETIDGSENPDMPE